MTQATLKLALGQLQAGFPGNAMQILREALAQQEPVAWPCLIDSADFSKGTVTIVMQCDDYKVSAGTHWLSPAPPQD